MKRFHMSDFVLLAVFTAISVHIAVISASDYDCFLNPDSTRYLGVAENLSRGFGPTLLDLTVPGNRRFLSIQPVGYPVLIWLLHGIVPFLSLVWSSKLLNILCVGLIILCFRFISPKNAYLYALLLFAMSFVELFTYSLTEAPFLAVLLIFTLALSRMESSGDRSPSAAATAACAAIMLFTFRYIGIFSVPILAILIIQDIRRKSHSKALLNSAAMASVVCFAVLYVINNRMQPGYTVRMHVSAPESFSVLLRNLVEAQLFEFNLLVNIGKSFKRYLLFALTLAIQGIIAWLFVRRFRGRMFNADDIDDGRKAGTVWRVGLISAAVYWLMLVILRFNVHFDMFNFRTLAPSTFLLFVSLINLAEKRMSGDALRWLSTAWSALMAVSFLLSSPLYYVDSVLVDGIESYSMHLERFKKKYASIPPNSLVGLADDHVRYLRPDCQPFYPLNPDYNDETLQEFIGRIRRIEAPYKYIEIRPVDQFKKWDETIERFLKGNSDKDFEKIE